MSAWSIVFQWLVQSAMASLVVSSLGCLVVLLLSRPARRIHVITLTMVGCLAAMLAGRVPGLPRWSVPQATSDVAPCALQTQVERPTALGPRPIGGDRGQERRRASAGAGQSAEDGWVLSQKTASPPAAGGHDPASTGMRREQSSRVAWVIEWRAMWNHHAPRSLAALYLIGAIVLAAGWLLGMVRLYRIVRRARIANSCVQRAWRQVGGPDARAVRVLISKEVAQPIACHVWRPTIVLPAAMETDADQQTLRWCLAHEQSHLERGDWWTWTLSGLVCIVFFYQPLVWWLRGRLRLNQDYLADAKAAEQSPEPAEYAEFLTLRASHFVFQPAIAGLGIGGGKSDLSRRVIMLVGNEPTLESRCPRSWRLSVLTAGLLVVGAVGTFGGVSDERKQVENTESRLGAATADSPRKPVAEPDGGQSRDEVTDSQTSSPGVLWPHGIAIRLLGVYTPRRR